MQKGNAILAKIVSYPLNTFNLYSLMHPPIFIIFHAMTYLIQFIK